MQNEVKNMIPEWCYGEDKYSLMLGDDIDSLLTALVVKHVKGHDINWFYDFTKLYVSDSKDTKEKVGCDMCLMKGKTFDNHVFMMDEDDDVNPDLVNLNAWYKVNRENYTDKYAGSTLLLVWAIYGLPLPKTREGKLILLSVDSAYLGHYNERFKGIHNEWLRKLGFEELIDFLDTCTVEDFQQVMYKYQTTRKIFVMDDGELKTRIKLSEIQEHFDFPIYLPEMNFKVHTTYKGKVLDLKEMTPKNEPFRKSRKVVSFALVYKDKASFTLSV